jgi:hypothetical protein
MTSPDRTEAAEYSLTYINQAPDGDIFSILDRQWPEALAFFRGISEELATRPTSGRSARCRVTSTTPNACSCSARCGLRAGSRRRSPASTRTLRSPRAHADERSWHSHVEEFEAIRAAKLPFFKSVRPDAWMRRGTASGNPGFHGGAHGGRGHR